MIKELVLKNVASYSEEGGTITHLTNVNFIYGANGTGKSTISQYLHQVNSYDIDEKYKECQIFRDTNYKILVYNQDFRNHVYHSENIPGVFTLGQATNEQLEGIRKMKQELQKLREELSIKRNTLNKNEEKRTEAHKNLKEEAWRMFKLYDKDFKEVFSGVRNNKENFLDELLQRRKKDFSVKKVSKIRKEELEQLYQNLYATTPTELEIIAPIDFQRIEAIEEHEIWEKAIIGNRDVDIAELIESLQMEDWIREGRQYLQTNNMQCPFCQNNTITEEFKYKIERYFDRSFQDSVNSIKNLHTEYINLSTSLIILLENINYPKLSSQELSSQEYQTLIVALKAHINENIVMMEKKLKSPSMSFSINKQKDVYSNITNFINETNKAIQNNNKLVQNIHEERNSLKSNVWYHLLNEHKVSLENLIKVKENASKACDGISSAITIGEKTVNGLKKDLEEANRNVTSTQPAIDAINRQLDSYGFHSFKICPHPTLEHHYQICRQTGDPVSNSLSEGEVTFITFLYFMQLINGALNDDSVGEEKIIVIDDPISSLDSTILYIVSSTIKELRDNVKIGKGDIKQLFILTHNVSFYRDVSFFNGRPRNGDGSLSYYLIRKPNTTSEVIICENNPIDSYYGLLWNELKQKNNSQVCIQNTMRRILEYYFKILGGWKDDQIISQFPTTEEKEICRSLICWINDGSHTIAEDMYIEAPDAIVAKYQEVFKSIFKNSNHIAHYNMMMGIEQSD